MSTKRKEAWLQADGCKLRIIAFENEPQTPVLVMLHGGPGSGADPLLELSAFQRLNKIFTTVYFDQRGAGKSRYDLSKQLTRQQAAKDVHEVVQWARKEYPNRPVYLWGASFGGLLSLLFLEQYPTDVDKAVVCSAAVLKSDELKATIELGRVELQDKLHELPRPLQDAFGTITTVSGELQQSDAMDKQLSDMEDLPKGFEGILCIYAMRSWFFDYDARPVLSKLSIPTLLMHGDSDPICPIQTIKSAYDKAQNKLIKFISLPDCGHSAFEDCEEKYVQEISDFLRAH